MRAMRQITHQPYGHIIANRNIWTRDGRHILYDIREDETIFAGQRIERVCVQSGEVEVLYEATGGACCGVPTCSPCDDRFVFIQGPEEPTPDWTYCAWHRSGALGSLTPPYQVTPLDARNLSPPFTPGALRGGTHLHMFSPDGTMVASTYEDHVLATSENASAHANRRVIAITLLNQHVVVPSSHPRNHSGAFTTIVTPVEDHPEPGSDSLLRAYSEAWIDNHSLAFLGEVAGHQGIHTEVFVVKLPQALARTSRRIEGTETTRPEVHEDVVIRRLTFTDHETYPGIQGPRHWAVPSPDGKWIGCFRRDDEGVIQFCVLDLQSGDLHQVTSHNHSATSCFTWSPDGRSVAFVADESIFRIDIQSQQTERLTQRDKCHSVPTHHACVYSPDGEHIAFMARNPTSPHSFTQIHLVDAK